MSADFCSPELKASCLDTYCVRKSIVRELTSACQEFSGRLLDAGCGKMPYREYILENSKVSDYVGLDLEGAFEYSSERKPHFRWDGVTMPFEDVSFDCAMATEVLEHVPDPHAFLTEVRRILRPEGVLFMTMPFLWPLHETPHDECRYTPFAVHRLLSIAGFKHIEIRALGGWHASLAQMLGLWVRRAPLTSSKKKILSWIALPLVRYLLKKDRIPENFHEQQMVTGLSVLAIS